MRPDDDQCRPLRLGDRAPRRRFEHVELVGALANVHHVPAVGRKTLGRVVVQRELGRPVDRDVIVVVEHRQAVQFERARQRGRLVTDALFETAVAGKDPGSVIDQFFAVVGAKDTFREGHTDTVGDALTQGAGRYFNGRRDAAFGMAGRSRVSLAEHRKVLDAQGVTEFVRQCVLQD